MLVMVLVVLVVLVVVVMLVVVVDLLTLDEHADVADLLAPLVGMPVIKCAPPATSRRRPKGHTTLSYSLRASSRGSVSTWTPSSRLPSTMKMCCIGLWVRGMSFQIYITLPSSLRANGTCLVLKRLETGNCRLETGDVS